MLLFVRAGCTDAPGGGTDAPARGTDAPTRGTDVRTGADVLAGRGFSDFAGRKLGLVVNHTSLVGGMHLVDLLHGHPEVTVAAIFGPEHGFRGNVARGEPVADDVDSATGIPIFSLYGAADRPSEGVLTDLDALVFDIQDIGARFYTYISTMGRAMQAAAAARIPFIVLDRPNPLGGALVDGYVLDPAFASGVGLYPIPIQHGMTVAELALMIRGESYLPGLDSLDLSVVEVEGWRREMLWPELEWTWIPTSPNIPTFETALAYPGTCLFEGTSAAEGRGTPAPFLTIGAPWMDAASVAQELRALNLPGVEFATDTAAPLVIPGVAESPKFAGEEIAVVSLDVTDPGAYRPLLVGIALLGAVYRSTPPDARPAFFNQRWMALLAGTDRLRESIESGRDAVSIVASWGDEVEAFRERRAPYLLYD